MRDIKRAVAIFALLVLALIEVLVFRSMNLERQARIKVGNFEEKIAVLESANRFGAFNDQALFELGKTCFDYGVNDLTDGPNRDLFLKRADRYLSRSIRLNPGYYLAHFYLALTHLYRNYFSEEEIESFDDFKRASLLAAYDTSVHYNVGQTLLENWSELSSRDQEYVVQILRKVPDLGDRDKLTSILHTWEASARDYDMINRVLPRHPDVFRLYASFLGEKNLSLEERQQKLAQAEFLEFQSAQRLYSRAKDHYRFYRLKNAESDFRVCLRLLIGIRFYQDLIDAKYIDPGRYEDLKKSVVIDHLKCLVALRKDFSDIQKSLFLYLSLERNTAQIKEIEAFLIQKKVLDDSSVSVINNLDRFACRIVLDYVQHRYREIVDKADRIAFELSQTPEGNRENLVRIFQLIGDSYQKMDFLYDSIEYFEKALDIDPQNRDTLRKLYSSYERMNNTRKMAEIQETIARITSSDQWEELKISLAKKERFEQSLFFETDRVDMVLSFDPVSSAPPALITVVFNDKVVWENYLAKPTVSLTLRPRQGVNSLELIPLDREIIFQGFSLRESGTLLE
jgi:tetratricopeptide (TPR) repeat protein